VPDHAEEVRTSLVLILLHPGLIDELGRLHGPEVVELEQGQLTRDLDRVILKVVL